MTAAAPRRSLTVSFHDLTPARRALCADWLADMAACGVDRVSLLVVPADGGGPRFDADTHFVAWLREQVARGHELCLHGWTHREAQAPRGAWACLVARHYTAGEGEFYRLPLTEAARRLAAGLAAFQTAGLPVTGFVPPAWLCGDEARAAARAAGLDYLVTWNGLLSLADGRPIAAPVLTYSARARWRRIVSRLWVAIWSDLHAGASRLRVAVHPGDLAHPALRAHQNALIARLARSRTPITYGALWREARA